MGFWLFLLPQAAYGASISFSPNGGQLLVGCRSSVDLIVNATGQQTNAANIEFTYSPSQITLIDQNSILPGVQVATGNAYSSYVFQDVNTSSGLVRIVAGGVGAASNGVGVFANIKFTSNPGVTGTSFSINYSGAGNTYDSNIADTNSSNDLLTSVTNASFTFVQSTCPENDTAGPQIINVTPTTGQTIPLDSNITFSITDDVSGVNIGSMVIYVNGIAYNSNDPQITYTGSGNSYDVTFNPSTDFVAGTPITIYVFGIDNNGNSVIQQINYNQPTVTTASSTTSISSSSSAVPVFNPEQLLNINPGTFLDNTPLRDSIVDNALTDLGLTGSGALVTGLVLGLNLLPLLSVANAPGLLLNITSFYLGRKHRRPWGVIIDARTSKPIPFATCRLHVSGTTTVVTQTVSDTEGRYGFVITPGKYRLDVSQAGYQSFAVDIEIGEGESGYVYDVRLVPSELAQPATRTAPTLVVFIRKLIARFIKWLQSVRTVLFVIGFGLSVLSILLLPNLLNGIIFGLYIFTFALMILQRFSNKPRYASVVDSESELRLPYAVVKIFDPSTWELVDTQMTNNYGFFDFWGKAGEYALLITLRGYSFPSKRQPGLDIITEKYSAMLRTYLTSGGNKLVIYVDPMRGDTHVQPATGSGANIPNPFN